MRQIIFTNPGQAGISLVSAAPIVAITFLESGYWPIFTKLTVDDLNIEGATPEIQEAAVIGSMFGWDCPGAVVAVEFFKRSAQADSSLVERKHVSYRQDIKRPDGNMSVIVPCCTCGWRGFGVGAYNDDQLFQVNGQFQSHVRAVGQGTQQKSVSQ